MSDSAIPPVTLPPGGTTILDGVGPPDPALGSVDEYYVDVVGEDLYGPRIDTGAADYVQPPWDVVASGAYEIGGKFRFDVAGAVTGIRYFFPNVAPSLGYILSLWDYTGGTLLATKAGTFPVQNAWNVINFDTPVSVLANHSYIASCWIAGLNFAYPTAYTGPVVSGHVRALADGEDGPAAYYGTSHAYPTTTWASFPPLSPMFTLGAAWSKVVPGFDEAPTDGTIYGRKNATWNAVPAAGGGDANFVFTQLSPSSVWNIPHNLGKFPSIEVVDSGGSTIVPNIFYVDSNNLTVSFGSATSGKVYCN